MNFKSYILAAASVVALSSAASAADLPARVVKPGIAPAATCFWQGPYVGAHLGYSWASFDNNLQVQNGAIVLPPVGDQKHSKFTGGGYAGYNFCVTPSLIVGLEADVTKYGNHKNWTGFAGGNGYGANFDANWGGSLRARIGLPFNRAMIYATGGLAGAQLSTETYLRAGGVTSLVNSGSKFAIGFAAGAGLEYAFTQNLVGRVEFIHTNLGNVGLGGGLKSSATFNTVRVGLGYKF
jgi:outer membrane immunogenic protein